MGLPPVIEIKEQLLKGYEDNHLQKINIAYKLKGC
jgi:hypothetical protein